MRYHCNTCFNSYRVTVGTLFHGTHIGLNQWFKAIYLLQNNEKEISVRKLAQAIQTSKNTAASVKKRICQATGYEPTLIKSISTFVKTYIQKREKTD